MKKTKGIEKRRACYALIPGLFFGFFLAFGYFLQKDGGVPYKNPLVWIAALAIGAVLSVLVYLFLGVKGREGKIPAVSGKKGIRLFLAGAALFMAVSWLIQLLGVYPGFFNYDATNQWEMYAYSQVTAHHPVLHTYLIGKCLHLSYMLFQTPLPGVFLYMIIQMVFSAIAFLSVIHYLLKKRMPWFLPVFATLWFALAPTVVMNVMSATKDSMFAAFFTLFVVNTAEALTEEEFWKKWYKVAGWLIAAFFSTILRNNAIYIMIPFLAILVWILRKKKKAFLLLGVIALVIIYLGPVTKLITVDGVNEREYLSVPVQQVMRVYHLHNEGLSMEEEKLVDEAFITDAKVLYLPKIADVAKGSLDREYFDAHKSEMIKLWADLGKKYPADYADAFFLGNYGFWYPFGTLVLTADGGEGYFVCRTYGPAWEESKIPAILSYFKHFENASVVCSNPLTMWIFAPATYFYMMLLVLVKMMYQRRKEAIAFVPVLFVWLTFLLGPVALVRYVSFLFYLLPFEIGLLLKGDAKKENE